MARQLQQGSFVLCVQSLRHTRGALNAWLTDQYGRELQQGSCVLCVLILECKSTIVTAGVIALATATICGTVRHAFTQ